MRCNKSTVFNDIVLVFIHLWHLNEMNDLWMDYGAQTPRFLIFNFAL